MEFDRRDKLIVGRASRISAMDVLKEFRVSNFSYKTAQRSCRECRLFSKGIEKENYATGNFPENI